MEKSDITWRLFGMYMLLLILMIWAGTAKAQMQLVVFNASWNDGNDVREWAFGMEDIQTYMYVDIGNDTELQKKHKIDLSSYKNINKTLALRNCVEPKDGLHIFNLAMEIDSKLDVEQQDLFST